MNQEAFMRLAIESAKKSQTPFGAVIVKDDKVIERAGNTVKTAHDPSCHAEVNAIRQLTQRLGNAAPSGIYSLYSTCEPCAMCAAACLWAGIQHVVYGVGAEDFEDGNPNMIDIRCEEVFQRSPKQCTVEGGLLRDDCKRLHQEFPLD
jgi:tRNA(Arg) A34 adenosine deaminase TadA